MRPLLQKPDAVTARAGPVLPAAAVPGILLTSLLPGWLLVRVVFPEERVRDPLSFARTLVLAVAFSIGITTVVGTILGFLPHGETGWFTPIWVVLGLLAASAGLFWAARARGAFPRLARRRTAGAGALPAAGRR